MGKIKTSEINVTIQNELNGYSERVQEKLRNSIDDTSKKIRSEIKTSAPQRMGAYANSWRVKNTQNTFSHYENTVYSPKHYTRVHLLENGHALRQGGRAKAQPHVLPAQEKYSKEFEKEIIKIIQEKE